MYKIKQQTLFSQKLQLIEKIKTKFKTGILGKEIYYFTEVSSTNLIARQLAIDGCKNGTLVIAESQKNGRGRMNRSWFSPYGKGIWCSLVLRPHFKPHDASKLTLLAAVAVQKAIFQSCNISCKIKWPNDIIFKNKKISGILTEINTTIENINYMIVGFGINVNINTEDFPEEIRNNATSISEIIGFKISRNKILFSLLNCFEIMYKLINNKGFDEILAIWRTHSSTIGQTISLFDGEKIFTGIATDIDADGALLISDNDKIKKFFTGDIYLI